MASNLRTGNRWRRDEVTRQVMAEESVCWLCGRPVDLGLRGVYVIGPRGGRRLHPDSPVIDEVVPVSRGGSPYDRRNCHLAHWRCNSYRGARTDVANVQAELRDGAAHKTSRVRPRPSQSW